MLFFHFILSLYISFSNLYLHFALRDIIQRVADVIKIYAFLHVTEALAVRTFAVQVTLACFWHRL